MNTNNVRIGFRLHTGWAVLVALAAETPLRVVHRCRLELLPAGSRRFAYHRAAELELAEAGKLIEDVRRNAGEGARASLRAALQDSHVTRACIPTGSTLLPEDLGEVLRSHARIHAAEGALYAAAIAAACGELGIPVTLVRERDVWARASSSTGMSEAKLKSQVDSLRKVLGPPWTADHKIATAAALL